MVAYRLAGELLVAGIRLFREAGGSKVCGRATFVAGEGRLPVENL